VLKLNLIASIFREEKREQISVGKWNKKNKKVRRKIDHRSNNKVSASPTQTQLVMPLIQISDY